MREFKLVCAATLTSLAIGMPTLAGPDWEETCDAGSFLLDAQPVAGPSGAVRSIKGKLGPCSPLAGGGPDFEDVYLIMIDNPAIFCAKTSVSGTVPSCCNTCPPDCVFAANNTVMNTQLWLFAAGGLGRLGNDDNPLDPPRSRIGNASNDGTMVVINTPGLYYLAISGGPRRDPVSTSGPIFQQATLTEISGPDGPGGAHPLSAWNGPGVQGDYTIVLCGVRAIESVPTVSEWGMGILTLLVAGAGAMLARRMAI